MLRLQNIRKAYVEPDGSQLPILEIPEFHVAAGEQMVLVGRSGSGKTTLLQIIAGISRPDSGLVQIAGLDITQLSEAGRDRFRAERIGYVFQTFNLLPAFSALENVLLGMTFTRTGRDATRSEDLLKRVGLGHRLTHRPTALSVGEQQRVAVARALANRPKVLLADEPTANVDSHTAQSLLDLMQELNQEKNTTFVFSSHDHAVMQRSREMILLKDGTISARGSYDEIQGQV